MEHKSFELSSDAYISTARSMIQFGKHSGVGTRCKPTETTDPDFYQFSFNFLILFHGHDNSQRWTTKWGKPTGGRRNRTRTLHVQMRRRYPSDHRQVCWTLIPRLTASELWESEKLKTPVVNESDFICKRFTTRRKKTRQVK